jgi:short-subunit dehydrogenase
MKTTLITGAANGLGYEFACIYAKENNNLLLVDIEENKLIEKANELKENFKVNIDYIVADLSNKDELKKVYNYTLEKDFLFSSQ